MTPFRDAVEQKAFLIRLGLIIFEIQTGNFLLNDALKQAKKTECQNYVICVLFTTQRNAR